MSVIIGIDVGGSTTKIVGLRKDGDKVSLIKPQLVRANDPITATYGAFGKFTDENDLKISDIEDHFRKYVNPNNMFVLPKEIGYLGEIDEFIEEQKR